MPELQQALFAVGSNIYQQAGGGATGDGTGTTDAGAGASSSTGGGGDDVIDADFTESK